MSEAHAAQNEQTTAHKPITELKVSAHLMVLEPGLFCIVQKPSPAADAMTGMPGVRLSLPPGVASRPEAVTISTFRGDGWLSGGGDAALVRVLGTPAHVLVTIYQSPMAKDGAPSLQVLRLMDGPVNPAVAAARAQVAAQPPAQAAAAAPPPAAAAAPASEPAPAAPAAPDVAALDLMAHIQTRGDVAARFGEWVGIKGSKNWIEGFGIAPATGLPIDQIEYQAVLGRGWMSPWVEGGQFCGSRGMALPILGLRVRLRGAAADTHDVVYAATFVDGAEAGPASNGEPCEAESLAAMESFRIELRPKAGVTAEPAEAEAKPAKKAGGRKAAKPKA